MIDAALFVAAVLLALYLLAPTRRGAALPHTDPRAALEAARSAALRSLHDLELDRATGKLSEADYLAQRNALEAEAAEAARRLGAEGERVL